MTPRLALMVFPLLAAVPVALALSEAPQRSPGDAPADAPDVAFALDASSISPANVFLAVRDASGSGGVGRVDLDCREIARWRTGLLADIALDGERNAWGVWIHESRESVGESNQHVVRYTATGAPGDKWRVPPGSVRIATPRGTSEVYVLHVTDDTMSERVTVFHEYSEPRSWTVPSGAVDVDVSSRGTSKVAVVSVRDSGGLLTVYDKAGAVEWQAELEVKPKAVAFYTNHVYVYATESGPAGSSGRVERFSDDGEYQIAWATDGLVPLDIAAAYDGVRVLGHPPGVPGAVTLRLYDRDGRLVRECDRLPQPSQPTPRATAVCPQPRDGELTWAFDGSGKIESAPATAADGTAYFGTLDGLMFAVDCAGRQKWVFDYREEGPEYGPQAFHGSPALDNDGTIYIGDDVVVPNFFFAVNPDGTVKWLQEFQTTYSQIDTSPALARDGRIFAGAHGWGAGVSFGCILVFDRDGRRVYPQGAGCGTEMGPITDSPVVLADGSGVFAVPRYHEWVLPTGTPPTATATGTLPTPTPTATPPTRTPAPPMPPPLFVPYAGAGSAARAAASVALHVTGGSVPDQPLPPPYITAPVPARLHQVHANPTPVTVIDLPGYDNPSSPAADGLVAWLTADGPSGPALLAYDFETLSLRHSISVPAPVAASPVLGRRDVSTGDLDVYLLGSDGTMYALSVSSTGVAHERWRRHVGAPADGAPAIGDDGRIYAAGGQSVVALSRGSGEPAWSVTIDAPASSSVSLAPGGMLYVGAGSGTLYAIGTSAGGLDGQSIWPSFRRDSRNTGSVDAAPIRVTPTPRQQWGAPAR